VSFASSRVRVFQFLPFLKADGVSVQVLTDDRVYEKPSFFQPLVRRWHRFSQRAAFLFLAPFQTIVFIQKIVFPRWYTKLLTLANPRVIFDLDDAIYTHTRGEPVDTVRLDYVLSQAHSICTTNEEIVQYAHRFNPRVERILGPIDCTRYRPTAESGRSIPVTIGWIGSPSTEKYLFLIQEAVAQLDPRSYRLICVGGKPDFVDRWKLPVEVRQWTLDTEVDSLEEFDIGVMPLPDDQWSRGKGGYKLMQYMAMGLPSVASAIGVNTELTIDGETGYLASSVDEWTRHLKTLIESPSDRKKMGIAARRRAVEHYSFERYYPLYRAMLMRCAAGQA
jgi:glycosyltransferase involved in cell wall biosynthesis